MPRVEQLQSNPFQMHLLMEENSKSGSTSYRPFQFSPVYTPALSPIRMLNIGDIDERRNKDLTKISHGESDSNFSNCSGSFLRSRSRENSFYSIGDQSAGQHTESGYCSSLELSLPRESSSLASIIHESCDIVNLQPTEALDSERISQESFFPSSQPRNTPKRALRQDSLKSHKKSRIMNGCGKGGTRSAYHRPSERRGRFVTALLLKQLIKEGIIEPGVNTLVFEDLEGKLHYGSLLPTGSIQANMKKGPIFRCVSAWIRHCKTMDGHTSLSFSETLRVTYRGVSFGSIMRVLHSDLPTAPAVRQLIRNVQRSSKLSQGRSKTYSPKSSGTQRNCSPLTSDASYPSSASLETLIRTLSMLLEQLTGITKILPTLLTDSTEKKNSPKRKKKSAALRRPSPVGEANPSCINSKGRRKY